MKKIVILGSTGSIGRQTLDVIRAFPGQFDVVGLAAGANLDLLQQQVKEFHPRHVCCLCSGQRPQSFGQPSTTSVLKPRGMVPGLLYRSESRYISASELISDSNKPWAGHLLRMMTRPSWIRICASTVSRHAGQILRVSS